MKTIFVVDDNDTNLLSAEKALSGQYRVFTLPSAESMFGLLEDVAPDLVLLDIEMPGTDGFETLRLLKSNAGTASIPVIFLTGRMDASSEALGFEMGAVDFITKPFSAAVLLNRIKLHLNVEALIRERTEALRRLKTSIVSVLARVVENRDQLTGGHIERTTDYIRVLLDAMRARGVYAEEIGQWDLENVTFSARLHDVGKIVISDLLLNKAGRLTESEFETIKSHVTEGEQIIESIIADSGDVVFLRNARLLAGYHHERWDGTGYPRGLNGEEIPLQGRIMAIVDVYDALVSERPYKPAFTHEKARGIIIENSGKHFDPKIVDAFLSVSDKFAEAGRGDSG